MKINMGSTDRMLRIILAIVVAILYFTKTIDGILALVLIVFAVIFLLTSLVGYCPLYSVFRFNTCKNQK